MSEAVAAEIAEHQIEPYPLTIPWSYGPETFDCWMVVADEQVNSGIAYCPKGVSQPNRKWILLLLDRLHDAGQDTGWFASLEEAYQDSWIALK